MVDISIEKYTHKSTIKVNNKKLFWVRMCDVQEEIGVKNMSDIVRKVIWGIFRTKIQQKIKSENIRREKELNHNSTATFVYRHSDLMSKIIKNCRGKKKSKKKKDFRCKLGF